MNFEEKLANLKAIRADVVPQVRLVQACLSQMNAEIAEFERNRPLESLPEEKLEIGDTVEILGCNCKPGSHGLGGILRRFGIRDYDVWLPWSKRTCIAYKVRLISKAPPASPSALESEPKSVEDYLAKVFPLWERGCLTFQEVKGAVDHWLESLKGKLLVPRWNAQSGFVGQECVDKILSALQQKIKEEK